MNKGNYVFINLMPYRQEIKKEQIKQFSLHMAVYAIISCFVLFIMYSTFSVEIDKQLTRNKYLTDSIRKLDVEIKEIANLQSEISNTLAKRKVVENLQVNRSDSVNMLNDLSLYIPDGVELTSLIQSNDKVNIIGVTNSNNKISNYMTNLAKTKTFMSPQLTQVTSNSQVASGGNLTQVKSNFGLILTLRSKVEEKPVVTPKSTKRVEEKEYSSNLERSIEAFRKERIRVQ